MIIMIIMLSDDTIDVKCMQGPEIEMQFAIG